MRSKTYVATPPGETIREQLEDRSMSQKEFAARMEMSEKHISRLINGDVQLTPDVAMRLEMVLGLPASFWMRLESIYREKLIRVQAENEMDEDLDLLKKFPYSEMAKNGWVEETRVPKERVRSIRKFFEVVRLGLVLQTVPQIACRKLGEGEKSDYALVAWAQKAKIEARSIETRPINIEKLVEFLPSIRRMTTQDPSVFCSELVEGLKECGIALVFLPHIGGSFLHGATFYDKSKIVVGMTVRGKDADKFWFSLFHELGHIVLGHISQANGTTDEDEREADAFARNELIPEEKFQQFVASHRFDADSITSFADEIEIDKGIVVGRLQKEGYILFSTFNYLKTKYELSA